MSKRSAIIIGAGPAGLTAAYRLSQEQYAVKVFEASSEVGGLSRTLELWGQRVDLGPHRFFSSNKVVNDFWHEVMGADYTMVDRLTRIYYQGKFFYYPLRPLDAFFKLGILDVTRCLSSYARVSLASKQDSKTFEDWVVNRFGRRLFEIFFKTYSEKLWGLPCSRIDADWAAQRIKKLSLFEAVKAAFLKDKKKTHKTLIDQFAYPTNGTGTLYQKMAERIRRNGGEVHLQSPVEQVLLRHSEGNVQATGVRLANGTVHEASHVVSTMPLTLMVKTLKGAPEAVIEACDKLYYRNIILVYVEVDSTKLFPDNWIYVHSPQVRHGRITNFRNWSPSLHRDKNTTILCLEFWCFPQDAIWQASADELGELAIKELRQIKIVPEAVRCLNTHVIKIPRGYPVYETGYRQHLDRIQGYLNSIQNLYAIGRYGAFKYNNQDHSILMGLLAAKEITTGESHNLWDVNTDSEYQESASIEDTGFQTKTNSHFSSPTASP